MGWDAEIFVFDADRYKRDVVPALVATLQTGVLDVSLEGAWAKVGVGRRPSLGLADLRRDCSLLSATDLGCESVVGEPRDGWRVRACRSNNCPSRTTCPFHRGNSFHWLRAVDVRRQLMAEDFHWLLQAALNDCLGRCLFVGRSFVPSRYRDSTMGHSPAVRELLERLGQRGWVVGYSFSNSGIQGWLDRGETHALSEALRQLDLPRIGADLDAIDTLRHPLPAGGFAYVPPEGYTFEQLSLGFIRLVSTIAAQEERGVLWGNDLGW